MMSDMPIRQIIIQSHPQIGVYAKACGSQAWGDASYAFPGRCHAWLYRDNQDENARLDFVMIVAISVLCNAW